MAPPSKKPSHAPSPDVPQRASFNLLPIIGAAIVLLTAAGGAYTLTKNRASFDEPFSSFSGERLGPAPTDQSDVPSMDAASLEAYNIVAQVPRLEWDPDRPFSHWAIEHDRPVILTNSAVHRWPALKKWTPQYLGANSRNLPLEFKTAGDPVFIYSQRKPLNRVAGLEFVRPFNLTNMDLGAFWERVSGQTDDIPEHERYLYFTGCITRSQDEVRRQRLSLLVFGLQRLLTSESRLSTAQRLAWPGERHQTFPPLRR